MIHCAHCSEPIYATGKPAAEFAHERTKNPFCAILNAGLDDVGSFGWSRAKPKQAVPDWKTMDIRDVVELTVREIIL